MKNQHHSMSGLVVGDDIRRLNRACEHLGINHPDAQMAAVFWSLDKAPAVAIDYADSVQKELHSAPYKVGDARYRDACMRERLFLETALRYMHSSGDLLASLINRIVLGGQLSESKCGVKMVREALEASPVCVRLLRSLDDFCDSNDFKRVAAMVNTMKHRQIIDTRFVAANKAGKMFKMGIEFLPLTGDDDVGPTLDRQEVFNVRERLIGLARLVFEELVRTLEERELGSTP